MQQTKKVVGLLVIMFIGIPTLMVIVWAVGFASAALSPEFITELPREIIETIPDMVQDILDAAEEDREIFSDHRDNWLKAMAKTDISTKQLLADIGISKWLENELSASLNTMSKIIRGEIDSHDVVLNMRPLKESLSHKALDTYFYKLLEYLPPCSEAESARWQELSTDHHITGSLPPCKPDPDVAAQVLQNLRTEIREEMPDEVDMFQGGWFMSTDNDMVQKAISFTYILFFIPAMFIILGSIIAATSKSSFFKWCGISTLIGGILPLAVSALFKDFVFKFTHLRPFYYSDFDLGELPQIFWEKLERIMVLVGEHLFGPVNKVAGVVCVVGILLFAISFVVPAQELPSRNRSQNRTTPSDQPRGTNGM